MWTDGASLGEIKRGARPDQRHRCMQPRLQNSAYAVCRVLNESNELEFYRWIDRTRRLPVALPAGLAPGVAPGVALDAGL